MLDGVGACLPRGEDDVLELVPVELGSAEPCPHRVAHEVHRATLGCDSELERPWRDGEEAGGEHGDVVATLIGADDVLEDVLEESVRVLGGAVRRLSEVASSPSSIDRPRRSTSPSV